MSASSYNDEFIVWGIDQAAYGPVDLSALMEWVKDERVTADSWVFVGQRNNWQRAADMPELRLFFTSGAPATRGESSRPLDPDALRRIKILMGLSDEQLTRFAQFAAVERVPSGAVVLKQGQPGDVMYLILEGELQVDLNVMGKDTNLATLGVGDFFGDLAVLDHGPRSADVIALQDCRLARISGMAFSVLVKEAPDLATPLLRGVDKTLTGRIRADNQRYADSVKHARQVE